MKNFLLDKIAGTGDATAFYTAMSNGMPMFVKKAPELTWGSTDNGTWSATSSKATFFHNGGKIDTVILDHEYRTYGRIHNILRQKSKVKPQLEISELLTHEILPNGVYISAQCSNGSFGIPHLLEQTMVKNFHLPTYYYRLVDDVTWVGSVLVPIKFPMPKFESFIKHRTRKGERYEVQLFTKFVVPPSDAFEHYTRSFDFFLDASKPLLNSADVNDIKLYASEQWAKILKI